MRSAVYAAAVSCLWGGFQHLYGSYLDAEQERVESMLMGQLLEQRARTHAAALEQDAP